MCSMSVGGSPSTALQRMERESAPVDTRRLPALGQIIRNAALRTVASESTKAVVGPVFGCTANGKLALGQLSMPVSIASLALGAGGLALGAYSVYSVHRLQGRVANVEEAIARGSVELQRVQCLQGSIAILQEEQMREVAKTRKGVAELQGQMVRGFAELTEAMQDGCQQLMNCVNDMSSRLTSAVTRARDETIQAMHEGFQDLHRRLDVDAQKELMESIEDLVEQYRHCFYVVGLGDVNTEMDCKRLEDYAIVVLRKIKSALKATTKGTVERLPLVALHIFATRARVDARDMTSPKADSPKDPLRDKLLKESMQLVKEEVVALLKAHSLTLYSVGVCLARTLVQYQLLHQGLSLALQGPAVEQNLEVEVDGVLVPTVERQDVIWDDGLDLVREILTEERGVEENVEAIELATLADLHWYVEWKELGMGTRLVQVPHQVMVAELLAAVGVPVENQRGLGLGAVEKLKALVLPSFRGQVEERLTKLMAFADADVQIKAGEKSGTQWIPTKPDLICKTTCSQDGVLVYAPDGTLFTVRGSDISHCRNGQEIAALRGHSLGVTLLALSTDNTLFSGSRDNTIKQWKDGKCIATISLPSYSSYLPLALTLAPDGAMYVGTYRKSIMQFKATKCIATLEGHSSDVTALALLPDGTLFSGSNDCTIKQWKNGGCIATLSGHTGWIKALMLAPDGRLFSASTDKTIKQWTWGRSGAYSETFEGHTAGVNALAVAPDGTLFSGSDDKTIKLWKGGQCIETIEVGSEVLALSLSSAGVLASAGRYDLKEWKVGECG